MKSGGNKEVLNDTIENLSKKIPELKIDVIQNPDNTSSEIVKNSFITKKVELIQKDLNVQFVAPILFTQEFHLKRALYIAQRLGIESI